MIVDRMASVYPLCYSALVTPKGFIIRRAEKDDREAITLPVGASSELVAELATAWLRDRGCPKRVAEKLVAEALDSGNVAKAEVLWSAVVRQS